MKKGQYLAGMLCLLVVNCLLVGSSVLTKEILGDKGFQNPFFLTYISAAIYTICVLPYLPLICNHCITPLKREGRSGLVKTRSETQLSLSKKVKLPTKCFGKLTEEPAKRCFVTEQSAEKIPLIETIKLSGIFGSILFSMNYLFNASMVYTSQGSSTLLSTSSSPFTLIFSMILLKEPPVWSNMVGVAMVFGASIWIAYLDGSSNSDGTNDNNGNSEKRLGDFYALLAAFIYGLYSVLMKLWIKDDTRISMFLYVGLVGFWNVIALWPFFFLFDYYGLETFQLPDNMQTIWFLVLNGLINVLFEIFWTRSILLISPTIACVGLSLSVPLGLVADYIFFDITRNYTYILGAVCVVAGFVLANVKTRQSLDPNSVLEKPLLTEEVLKDEEVL